MAKKVQVTTAPWEITVVTTAPPTLGATRRNPAAATVSTLGNARLNQQATELLREVVRQAGYTDARYAVQIGVNAEAEVVVLYAVDPGTTGSIVPRATHDGKRVSINLGGAFAEFESLRGTATRHCPVNIATDKNGKTCLVITLKGTYNTTSPRPRRSSRAKTVETE